jgi:hypothetical protein
MAHVTADRVRDTATTTGTGAFTVSGTAPTGYRTFSAVCSTSDTFWYCIAHQAADEWEVGLGTYSGTNTVTRTTVLKSSNSNSAVSFSAGTKDVFITLAADKTVQQEPAGFSNIPSVRETVFTITDAAGFQIDPANGGIQTITLGANRTPAATNFLAGQSVTLMIADGSAFTITWSTVGVTWVGGSAPTLATSGWTVVELWKVGSTIYGAHVGDVA